MTKLVCFSEKRTPSFLSMETTDEEYVPVNSLKEVTSGDLSRVEIWKKWTKCNTLEELEARGLQAVVYGNCYYKFRIKEQPGIFTLCSALTKLREPDIVIVQNAGGELQPGHAVQSWVPITVHVSPETAGGLLRALEFNLPQKLTVLESASLFIQDRQRFIRAWRQWMAKK